MIIPCFNDGEFIEGAVASVDEQEGVEILVVDDGSDDSATLAALDRLREAGVDVLAHEVNRGLSAARMSGVVATSAPFVFPLDSDDELLPGSLAAMAGALDAHPDAVACVGDYLEFGNKEMLRAVPPDLDPFRITFTNEYPVTALFRRSALESTNGWTLHGGYEDWDLWMTFAERGDHIAHLGAGRPTYRRRLHTGRMGAAARTRHREKYARLRRSHPLLFSQVAENRRRSPMSVPRKALYPLIYGGRRRWAGEPRVKSVLDRVGIWTLRR